MLEVDLKGDATFKYTPKVEGQLMHSPRAHATANHVATLKAWGYPQAETGSEGGLSWRVQQSPNSGTYCIMWSVPEDPRAYRFTLLFSVELCPDGDPLAFARIRMGEALESGRQTLYEQHSSWWQEYWKILL